jgi:hypothetical protein
MHVCAVCIQITVQTASQQKRLRLVWNRFHTGNERIRSDEETAKEVFADSLSWEFVVVVPSENF